MQFNNRFAVLLTCLVFLFLMLGAILSWENKVSDMATGALIAILTLVAQFYFRTRPPVDSTGTTTTTTTTADQSTMTAAVAPGVETAKDASGK